MNVMKLSSLSRDREQYDKRDKEKGQNATGRQGRGGEANRPSKPFQNQGKPARGQEKETCDHLSDGGNEEETSEQEFQRATDALCFDGGVSLHSSHRHLKR